MAGDIQVDLAIPSVVMTRCWNALPRNVVSLVLDILLEDVRRVKKNLTGTIDDKESQSFDQHLLGEKLNEAIAILVANRPLMAKFFQHDAKDCAIKVSRIWSKAVNGSLRQPKTLLDIGCGVGLKTAAMAAEFGIPSSRALGYELNSSFHDVDIQDNAFSFRLYNGESFNDVVSESQDLVTVLMVLHHCADPLLLLSETYRVLCPGGFLIIREHDVVNDDFAACIDVLHAIFSITTPGAACCCTKSSSYRTKDQWNDIIESYPFHNVSLDNGNTNGIHSEPTWDRLTRGFYRIYRKQS